MLSIRPPSLLKRFLIHTLTPTLTSSTSASANNNAVPSSSHPLSTTASLSTLDTRSQIISALSNLKNSTIQKRSLETKRTFMSSSPVRERTAARIPGPIETAIQTKIIEAFQPELVRISNDSSKHAHHAPMRAVGGGSGETHFAVAIVSASFAGKTQIARHRLVNNLLKDEFDQGLHALSLRLKTPEEWAKETSQ